MAAREKNGPWPPPRFSRERLIIYLTSAPPRESCIPPCNRRVLLRQLSVRWEWQKNNIGNGQTSNLIRQLGSVSVRNIRLAVSLVFMCKHVHLSLPPEVHCPCPDSNHPSQPEGRPQSEVPNCAPCSPRLFGRRHAWTLGCEGPPAGGGLSRPSRPDFPMAIAQHAVR